MRRNVLLLILIFSTIRISVWCQDSIHSDFENLYLLLKSTATDDQNVLDAKNQFLEHLEQNTTEDSMYQELALHHKGLESAIESLDAEKIRLAYSAYIIEKQKLNEQSGQVYGIFILIFSVFIILGILVSLFYNRTVGELKKEKNNFNTILKTQEAERKRISLELHDSIAQKMRYVGMLASRVDDKNAPEIKTLQSECIKEIRSICYNLFSPDIERGDLASAIQMLASDFKERTEIETKFYAEENIDLSLLQTEQMHNIFRIAQEALANIEKHAKANEVTVILKNSQSKKTNKTDGILIIITDDGIGMDETLDKPYLPPSTISPSNLYSSQFGIVGMNSRAKNLGGSISFNSIPNEGTEVKLFVPNSEAKQ